MWGVVLSLLLFKGVLQGALFFVVFRVWLFKDFEGFGFFDFGEMGAEQFWSFPCSLLVFPLFVN